MNQQQTISLTSIFVQDPKSKGFTVFFKQFPEVLAEGKDEDEALRNLINILQDSWQYKASHCEEIDVPHGKVIEKSVNFSTNLALA
jgi:predicted RNase H-like HicB family nuclease